MGSLTVCCPIPSYLADAVTTLYPCKHEFGQIKKLLFWRRDQSLTSVASAIISTTWTAKLIATGNTKVVVTPFVVGKVVPGEPRESGGGNEGIDGIPTEVVGNHPSVVEFKVLQWDQDVITFMKSWGCENLDVIFINENGAFGYSDGGATAFKGFPIGGMSISDLEFGDFDGADFNKLKFYLRSNWSDTFEISTSTTFALTLIN